MEARRDEWVQAENGRKPDDYRPDMPPLEGAEYLIDYLFEIGPTMAAGMGEGPITHGELRSWQKNVFIRLKPWECRFLRRLSMEYLKESHRAETLGSAPPWKSAGQKAEPTATQLSLRALAQS